jgi:hypothetical protein
LLNVCRRDWLGAVCGKGGMESRAEQSRDASSIIEDPLQPAS